MKMKKSAKGFTLIELMIVVAIIAILAAVALPSFGQQVKKSRDSKAIQMMGTMRSQLGMTTADLGGENPTDNTVSYVFTGGTVTGTGAATTVSKGIQGITKFVTITAASPDFSFKAGTPATVTAAYAEGTGAIEFDSTAGVNDTKGTAWASY